MAFVVGSLLTPMLVKRIQPAHLMAAGLTLAAPGFALFTRVDETASFLAFALGTFVFSFGFAPVFTLTTDLIVGSAPPERAGAASAISETSAEFGGAMGIAVFGSIGVAVYRAMIGDALPRELPADALEAARGTLGGAVDVARQLPAQTAEALVTASRAAFLQGLRLVAGISVVGTLGLALFAMLTLGRRGGRPSSASEGGPSSVSETAPNAGLPEVA
jgi:DHA2 family multidrug resistance protein-like MFS transporter